MMKRSGEKHNQGKWEGLVKKSGSYLDAAWDKGFERWFERKGILKNNF
jgi:hypothetical protein